MRTSIPLLRSKQTSVVANRFSFLKSQKFQVGAVALLLVLSLALPLWLALWAAIEHHGFMIPLFVIVVALNVSGLAGASWLYLQWQRSERERLASIALNEKRYRVTAEMMSDYTFYKQLHADGTVARAWISGAFEQVTGYTASELIIDNARLLYHPEDQQRAIADRRRVLAGETVEAEYRILRRDDALCWVRIVRVPDWDDQHQHVIGYYGVGLDITEGKRAEEERLRLALRQQQFALMSEFVHALSHDFRNRLSTIESNRYIIARITDGEMKAKIDPRLDNIRISMQGIMEQIENLNIIAGLGGQSLELTDINLMLKHFVHCNLGRALEKHVRLSYECSDVLCMHLDREQMERVMYHLVDNALAHTQAGGEIMIRARRDAAYAEISVADSGEGIAVDDLNRVFEPFYRGDDARTINEAGLGVGLTIARLIVEAHHGTIEVSSQPGRGTTFRIRLPLRESLIP